MEQSRQSRREARRLQGGAKLSHIQCLLDYKLDKFDTGNVPYGLIYKELDLASCVFSTWLQSLFLNIFRINGYVSIHYLFRLIYMRYRFVLLHFIFFFFNLVTSHY